MNIKYISTHSNLDQSISYQLLNEIDEEIGTAEGFVSQYGELVTVIKVFSPDFKKKGIGFNAFKKIFDELNIIVPINTIKGSWHKGEEFRDFEDGMSTNMKVFLSCLKEENNKNKCVFNTPTGKWAQKLGYVNYSNLLISTNEISVNYIK